MIQDIAPHHLYNEYQPAAAPQATDLLLCVRGQELWARRGVMPASAASVADASGPGAPAVPAEVATKEPDAPSLVPTFAFPQVADVPADHKATLVLTYAFALDGRRLWLARDASGAPVPGDAIGLPECYEAIHTRDLRLERRGPRELVFAAYTAVHLADWYAKNRFCGRCGKPLEHHATLRAMSCPACGNLVFPRLNPAIIACVHDPQSDRIAITRYAAGRYKPVDALVAGFVELGETLEECVAREVREELGLKVRDIRYYRSQPWGVAGDILAGFWAEVDGDPTIHRDATELGSARWATPEEIPGQGDDYSLTNEMMCLWRDRRLPRGGAKA